MDSFALVWLLAPLSVLALGVSVVSLAIHWVRRNEHPDVSRLHRELQELRGSQVDLLDKVEHWMRRDRTRRLRESHEPKDSSLEQSELQFANPSDRKRALRATLIHGRR